MFIVGGIVTQKSSAEIGSLLMYLFEHPADASYFQVDLIRHHPDGDQVWLEWVRLIDDLPGRVITLANGQELVRCKSKDGRKIDFMFGAVADRELEPPVVFVEGFEP